MKKIFIISIFAALYVAAWGQKTAYEGAKKMYYKREYARALKLFYNLSKLPNDEKEIMNAQDSHIWAVKCIDSLYSFIQKGGNYSSDNYDKALFYYDKFCEMEKHFTRMEIDNFEKIEKYQGSKLVETIRPFAISLSSVYNRKGCCYVHLEKYEEAKECFKKAIDYNEDNPYPYSNIARGIRQGLFKNTTKYSEVWLYEKAFNLGNKDTWVADSITVEYERLKFYGEASKWAKKGAEMGSNYSKVRLANYFMFHYTSCHGLSLTASKILSYLNEAAKDETEKIAAEAKLYLGVIYTNGKCGNESIAKNEYLAKKLINESAALGNKQAKELQNAINGY